MQKAISTILALSTLTAQASRTDDHPFTRENYDSDIIDLGYRRSHRAHPVADTVHKYGSLESEHSYPTYISNWDKAVTSLLGPSESQQDFQGKYAKL